MQSNFLFFPYRLSFSKIGIIDEENRITKMINIEHVTELEKKNVFLSCHVRKTMKKPWVSLESQESIDNFFVFLLFFVIITITDGRKSVLIRPMNFDFAVLKNTEDNYK